MSRPWMRFGASLLSAVVAAAWSVAACVGDDPGLPTTQHDAGGLDRSTGAEGSTTEDGASADCDPTKPFGAPEPLPGLSSVEEDVHSTLADDERLLIFSSRRDSVDADLWVTTRSDRNQSFVLPARLAERADAGIATDDEEFGPKLTEDGNTLVFGRATPVSLKVLITKRQTKNDPFGLERPALAPSVDKGPIRDTALLPDGSAIYLSVGESIDGAASFRLERARLDVALGQFVDATPERGLPPATIESPVIAADDKTLFFSTPQALSTEANNSRFRLWIATRQAPGEAWNARIVDELRDTPYELRATHYSADHCRLYVHGLLRADQKKNLLVVKRGR